MLEKSIIGDILISDGESTGNAFMKFLFGRIRAVQKGQGLNPYSAVHVQIKGFRDQTGGEWVSAEEDGVKLHTPGIVPGRHYRLVRMKGGISDEGIHALQDYLVKMIGKPYDKLQLAGIAVQTLGFVPKRMRRWLSRRFDGGGAYEVCSSLVWEGLQRAGAALPKPRIDPDRSNPQERFMPAEFEPANNPDYFELVAEQ